jgi:hypothetical protein
MPVVVPCPKCAAKLKAPDGTAGKKVRCKSCGTSFRIPGGPAVADSIGDADVPVADLIEDAPAAPAAPVPAKPAAPVSALASADPFDFGKPKAPSAPIPAPAARPAFGAAKAEAPKPAAPVPAAPAKPAPVAPAKPQAAAPAAPPKPADAPKPQAAAPVAPPAAKPAPAAPKAEAPKPAPPPPAPEPTPVADVVEEADNMFAFGDAPAAPAAKKSRRYDEDDEDDKPRAKKKRVEDDEDDEDDAPRKGKAKGKADGDESYNPFAGYPTDPEPEPEPKPKKRKGEGKDDKDGDDAEEDKPRYLSPKEKGSGTGKALMTTLLIGGVAVALGVLATVVYIKNTRKQKAEEAEMARVAAEKEKERLAAAGVAPADPAKPDQPKGPAAIPDPPRPSIPDPPRPDGKKDKVDPKTDPKTDPKVDPKIGPKVDPKVDPKANPPKVDGPSPRPKDPGPQRAVAALPKTVAALNLGPPPKAKGEKTDGFKRVVSIALPLAQVVRAFPPPDAEADTFVVVRTAAGAGGTGERLALDTYGSNDNFVPTARIEYDGDGQSNPIIDVYAQPKMADKSRFLAAPNGRLHVWNVSDKRKLADGIDPYFGTPHAAAGLAAAFLTSDPNLVVTVSTAGAVHLYDIVARKAINEFIPPHGAPGRVAPGTAAARNDAGTVAVAVGGIVYQLEAKPGLAPAKPPFNIGGDVGRSLALAVADDGRLLYSFETAGDAKKDKPERVVVGLTQKGAPIYYRLPDAAGDPRGAVWTTSFGGLTLDRGLLLFDGRDGRFLPSLLAQSAVPSLFAGTEDAVWCALAVGAKSGLGVLETPFKDFLEPLPKPVNPVRAYTLGGEGLSR